MRNVSIIGTAGIPAKYGGFETLAENLVLNIPPDVRYTVFALKNFIRVKLLITIKILVCVISIYLQMGLAVFYMTLSLCADRCSPMLC